RHVYTSEEMDAVFRGYAREAVRGTDPRYWEDVKVGDELGAVVKGPLTTEDILMFMTAVKSTLFYSAFLGHWRRHPADVYVDPDTNAPDTWDASLVKDAVAQEFGFPAAHDSGFQRVAWIDNLITNWAGDLAFI